MKRERTIKYITQTAVDEMVKDVIVNGRDINHVIQAALESRKVFGLRVQEFVNRLEKLKEG